MQTNTDKVRIFKDVDKEPRIDPKRDKFNAKEQRRNARRTKLSSREIE